MKRTEAYGKVSIKSSQEERLWQEQIHSVSQHMALRLAKGIGFNNHTKIFKEHTAGKEQT